MSTYCYTRINDGDGIIVDTMRERESSFEEEVARKREENRPGEQLKMALLRTLRKRSKFLANIVGNLLAPH